MTVRIPPENILDKILKLIGKERQANIPAEAGKAYRNMGTYVQIRGQRESFFKALFRKNKNQKPERQG